MPENDTGLMRLFALRGGTRVAQRPFVEITEAVRASSAVRHRAADSARWLRATLWVLQGSLAVVFGAAGWAKLAKSGAALQSRLDWTADVPLPLLKLIGVCEILGAVGVFLPAATRIRPELTPVAGTCLATVMALAFAFHVYRGDMGGLLIVPAALGVASAIVAWARLRKVPVGPRASLRR